MKYVRYERGIRGQDAPTPPAWGVLDDTETVRELSGPPYLDAAETGATFPIDEVRLLAPAEPRNLAVVGPNARFVLPADTARECYGEVALVIGRQSQAITDANAFSHVFGYTCATRMRDGHGPFSLYALGPMLVTDYNPDNTRVLIAHNGLPHFDTYTVSLRAAVARAVALVSQDAPLDVGDIVLVGRHRRPILLQSGDVVTVEADGIGRLVTVCGP